MECELCTPHAGVTFCTAIEDDSLTQSQNSGLTPVIRYRFPYTILEVKLVGLFFGIGDNVAVNAIIRLPVLKKIEDLVDLQYNTLNYKAISQIVSLSFDGGSRGFLPGVSYDSSSFNIINLSIPSISIYHNINSSVLFAPIQRNS